MATFEELKLNKQLLTAIAEAGFTEPTPIQARAIPLILAGHDVLGIAQTGTGKTAAYVLPLLMKIKYAQGSFPRALIISPTRELAVQIATATQQFAKYTDLRIVCVYGGVGMKNQIKQIQQGVDILIATPGRLLDIYFEGELPLKQIEIFVIDEADKMMDMGFMPQINQILELIPAKKRQNLLFSATMPPKVMQLVEEFLEYPQIVEITPQATPAQTISQSLIEVPNFKTKINLLAHFLQNPTWQKVIIFTRTRLFAENIYRFLKRKLGQEAVRTVHANKAQQTRINAMNDFKEGNVRILVATDVAARGIDVSQVSHVVNFDVPLVYEDYVHRIGRTGRANHKGEAITFVLPSDEYHIRKIEKIIKMTIPRLPIPAGVEVPETDFEEKQAIAKAIDDQRKKENPDFQGAFHEKKAKNISSKKKSKAKSISKNSQKSIKKSNTQPKTNYPKTKNKSKKKTSP
ncbi:MAG: DEAD/DEAH box helicase [Microscillaceae bacterium]|nr:DEAD/DEAH box helicase [Microscillaceae bacterium]MDW8459620.1 DEAD/DEAH box helicase [Cytophagales bacterium]